MKKATVYSKEVCPYCVKAKEILKSNGVEIEEIKVGDKISKEDFIEKITPFLNGKDVTVPQIFIGEEYIGGCDDLEKQMSLIEEKEEIDFESFSL